MKKSIKSYLKYFAVLFFLSICIALCFVVVSFAQENKNTNDNTTIIDKDKTNNSIDDAVTTTKGLHSTYSTDCLCFTPDTTSGTAEFSVVHYVNNDNDSDSTINEDKNFQYSYNLVDWTDITLGQSITIDRPAYLKGDNPDGINYIEDPETIRTYYYFNITGDNNKIKASGNIMSLLDDGQAKLNEIPCAGCFSRLFSIPDTSNNNNLTVAPNLPATKLKEFCYALMFFQCYLLTSASNLPATELTMGCYMGMLGKCISLTQAPELPATKLEEGCYTEMFIGCISLVSVPVLPATKLKKGCYAGMFAACKNISSVTVYFKEWYDTEDQCATLGWLTSAGSSAPTFNCVNTLDVSKRDISHIPEGWTINNTRKPDIDVEIQGYSNFYDAQTHGITITLEDPDEGATIEYSSDGIIWSKEEIKKINVGTYTVWYRISHPDYQIKIGTATINISQIETTAAFTGGPFTKNYGEADPSFNIEFSGLLQGDVPILNVDYVVSRKPGETVNVAEDSYPVYFHWIRDSNYYFEECVSSLTIEKSDSLILSAEDASKIDGDEDPPFKAHMEGLKFNDILNPVPGTDYDISVDDTNNPSIKTLIPYLTEDGKNKFKDKYDLDNMEIETAELLIYDKGGQPVVKYNASHYSGVYDGAAHSISVTVTEPSSYTIQYRLEGGEYSPTKPTFTNVTDGPQTVYYKITSSDTTYETIEGSETVNIEKAKASISADSKEMIEGQTIPELTAKVEGEITEGDITAADYSLSHEEIEGPGSYEISVSFEPQSTAAKNYDVFSNNAILQVNTKNIISFNSASYSGVYDGAEHSISVEVYEPTSYTILYKTDGSDYSPTKPTFTNVTDGAQTVYYKITTSDTTYETIEGSETVNIPTAPVTIAADYKEMVSGQEEPPLTATITGLLSGDKLREGESDGDYHLTCEKRTGAGTYSITVYWHPLTDTAKNYEASTVDSKFVVKLINKTRYSSSLYSGVYDGAAHSVSVEVHEPASYTILYKTDGSDYSPTKPTFTNVTDGIKTVYYKIIPSDTTYETIEGSETVNISTAPVTIAADYKEIVSGQEEPDFTATITGLLAGDKLREGESDGDYHLACEKRTGAGTYSITVYWHPLTDTAKNYEASTVDSKFVVKLINKTRYSSNLYSSVYDGAAHSISVEVYEPTSYTILYKTDGSDYSPTKPTFTNVTDGLQTVYYKITPSDTTYETIEGSETVNIEKAVATIVPDAVYKNEGEVDPQLTAQVYGLVNGESFVPEEDYKVIREKGEDPGTYVISCEILDNEKTFNYNTSCAESKFFIMAIAPLPPGPTPTPTPDPTPVTPTSGANNGTANTGDYNLLTITALAAIMIFATGALWANRRKQKNNDFGQ